MAKLSLGSRLFLSHMLVMLVGLGSFVSLAKISSPRMFILRLEELESQGFITVRSAKTYLIRGFETAWNRSSLWAIIFGASAAGGLSFLAADRIMQPLDRLKLATKNLAEGDLQSRMPPSDIPELEQLGESFNRMADSLADVEQQRRELVSDLTHELRSPLTVVRGYLEQLAEGTIAGDPELYQRLVGETRRLERLTVDLQELSKVEAGYLSIQRQPLDLYPLLVKLQQRFADQLLEEGPELILAAPSPLPPVLADPDRTEQILVNLIGNAVRYTPSGAITIDAHLGNDQEKNNLLWVTVTDTGIGIAAGDLPYVFERFWRADKSRSRYSGGTGLGLAIAKRLVELQGGNLLVRSTLGHGSEFSFSLPLV
ncbi:HAMP domain-containing histidine kinase [Synechocystis sp. LEGE 06083]|uniref:sensor histidine kinase n=1 Tax=Synechocystis sp. LEGE 06083 TaxID=915336 RepID=UPI00187E0CF3|nr:HAMP domain-containing sensor histidine kinase [Synechocystis sp. LEGE 06083]MBE9195477.1 HAMP domain-containing histidine kinase [Synechocystis sp. LEGE 06083]